MNTALIIAWVNLYILVLSTILFLLFYALSVSPAALSKIWGEKAYARCFKLRGIAMLFEFITLANYLVYWRYPVQAPLPLKFPWPYGFSLGAALLIGLPAAWLMVRGMRDAGEETARPDPSHTMYGGIYRHLRHPQALGESFLWLAAALAIHSPFLVIFSTFYFPLMLMTTFIEEHDLLIRYGDAYADYIHSTGLLWPKKKDKDHD